jgi:flagellar motility protein MotE (MotC chaperone)
MLDEGYSFESVGGPFSCMMPSFVLKTMDPVAYRCGRNDWVDGEDFIEVRGEEYETRDLEEIRDGLLSELEDELSELDDQSSELDEDSDDYEQVLAVLCTRRETLKADINQVRRYIF